MSKKIRTSAWILALLGLTGVRAAPAADPLPIGAGEAPTVDAEAPQGPAATTLLLTDGKVIQGKIFETDTGYVVQTNVGEIPYRRHQVEGAFTSLGAAYRHRLARTPPDDPDEQLKLAQWCLAQQLREEARERLAHVLKLTPEHPQAKYMMFQLAANTAAPPRADAGLVRTGGETTMGAPPAALNLNRLREEYRRNPSAGGVPVIFDVPPPQAVKRYQEFASYVHPALQRACANCHGEQSNSKFQLIQVRAKRDYENDLITRTNLDATLRLIDPASPTHSPLLTSAIMPHPPNGRPVLTGPNHPTYRLVANWLERIRASSPSAGQETSTPVRPGTGTGTGSGVARAEHQVPTPPPPAPGRGGFAADRLPAAEPAAGAPMPAPAAPVRAAGAPMPAPVAAGPGAVASPAPAPRLEPTPSVTPTPAGQIFAGTAQVEPAELPPDDEFPVSPLVDPSQRVPAPAPRTVAAPKATGKAETAAAEEDEEEGPTIFVPGLGKIPVVDTTKVKEKPRKKPASKGASRIDASALEKFMTGRPAPK